jgi:hypothetical protein
MSILQLTFQAVLAQNLIETKDYKFHKRKATNELTGQAIDDI